MSIEIQNLTKIYGTQKAVDNASFQLSTGEIVGFLGPNGAGKTTTMKILTSYITPTSGEAFVVGKNVVEDPMETRKNIGYLAEHNPLYLSMYVREYLRFIASLHKLKNVNREVDRVVSLTGLGKEQHKIVRALSKGYRQRLGLAQALIHDPKVLILDEPTSGLDPNQLVEIRDVIRTIGQDKTILFSSHIMQEVEALCERLIIIHEGKIVADTHIDEIDAINKGSKSVVSIELSRNVDIKFFQKIPNVDKVIKKPHNRYVVHGSGEGDLRANIYAYFKSSDISILEMQRIKRDVEDVFQSLTKKRTGES